MVPRVLERGRVEPARGLLQHHVPLAVVRRQEGLRGLLSFALTLILTDHSFIPWFETFPTYFFPTNMFIPQCNVFCCYVTCVALVSMNLVTISSAQVDRSFPDKPHI